METREIRFDEVVGGKPAAILVANGSGMRRVVFAPLGFLPKNGVAYRAMISPACNSRGPMRFIHNGEPLHIHNCQLEEEAGFIETIDHRVAQMSAPTESPMAAALRVATERAGREIPVVKPGRLQVGQKITLRVALGTDRQTGLPAFEVEYFNNGDPLLEKGENSMRIFHVRGSNPGLKHGQKWQCEVREICISRNANSRGHRFINIWVKPEKMKGVPA